MRRNKKLRKAEQKAEKIPERSGGKLSKKERKDKREAESR